MLPYELFKVLKRQFGSREAIVKTNEMIGEIEYNPKKYIQGLCEEVDEESSLSQMCPLCGEDLIITKYEEGRGEYQGSDSFESECIVECSNSNCSYAER